MSQSDYLLNAQRCHAAGIIIDWLDNHGIKPVSIDYSRLSEDGLLINYLPVITSLELDAIFASASLNRENVMDSLDSLGRFDEERMTWDISKPWIDLRLQVLARNLDPSFNFDTRGKFRVIVSHDVDRTTGFEPTALLNALLKLCGIRSSPCLGLRTVLSPLALLRNVERLLDYEASHGVGAIYFMLAGPYGIDRYSSRTDINWSVARKIIQLVNNSGMRVGLHGSYSAREHNSYAEEKKRIEDVLGSSVNTHRNHYLRFDSEKLPSQLDNAKITYDFSVGFTNRIGFRGGYAGACRTFNFAANQSASVISIPLLFMDSMMLGRDPMLIIPELRRSLEAVQRVNGCVSVLFHPESFLVDDRFFLLFKSVIQLCQELGADLSGDLPILAAI